MNQVNEIKTLVGKYVSGKSNRNELAKALELFRDPSKTAGIRSVLFYYYWNKTEEKNTTVQPLLETPSAILHTIHRRICSEAGNKKKISTKRGMVNLLNFYIVKLFDTNIKYNQK